MLIEHFLTLGQVFAQGQSNPYITHILFIKVMSFRFHIWLLQLSEFCLPGNDKKGHKNFNFKSG